MSTARNIKSVTSPVTKLILKTVGLAGYAGVIVIAPNAVQAIDQLIKISNKSKVSNRYKYYANGSGYFNVERIDDCKYAITLTEKGSSAAKDLLFEDYRVSKPSKWDGRWRVLSFDIAEEDRALRDALRVAISRIGMKLIQNSVYVYPYPIDEFVDNIHERYPKASKHLIAITAVHIDGQDQLIKFFKNDNVL